MMFFDGISLSKEDVRKFVLANILQIFISEFVVPLVNVGSPRLV